MSTLLQKPNAEQIRSACERFDRENELVEQSLAELFLKYPDNSDLRHVMLKVTVVNSLYHTCIFALDAVARHIHTHHEEIDSALHAGSPEIVDKIAKIKVNGKTHNFFSFASKYASWHNSNAYPIYDSHVDNYLWTLQKQSPFTGFLHPELWEYPKFHRIVTAFRDFHSLNAFTFKDIDKFLYYEGAPPPKAQQEEIQTGPGAFDFFPAQELSS